MKDNLISISTIMLKEEVKFTFGDYFLMDPIRLVAVSKFLPDAFVFNINKKNSLDSKQHNSNRRFSSATGMIKL